MDVSGIHQGIGIDMLELKFFLECCTWTDKCESMLLLNSNAQVIGIEMVELKLLCIALGQKSVN